jgi:hypothetical protein
MACRALIIIFICTFYFLKLGPDRVEKRGLGSSSGFVLWAQVFLGLGAYVVKLGLGLGLSQNPGTGGLGLLVYVVKA